MLKFNSNEPFPLLPLETHSYSEAQNHSAFVDAWLGLKTAEIEETLSKEGCRYRASNAGADRQELWLGLAVSRLLTPYTEIRHILARLAPQPGNTVIDLGAGYGRMGFVVARHFPLVHFIGYEFVGERVREGRRCLQRLGFIVNVKLIHADLSSLGFAPLSADFYFIFDFGTFKAVDKTLHDLRRIAQNRKIVVAARGRLCHDLIERRHPWLSQINPADRIGHSSIYRS